MLRKSDDLNLLRRSRRAVFLMRRGDTMDEKITPLKFANELRGAVVSNSRRNIIFFLGAGCSASSGVPLGKQLSIRWMKEYIQLTYPDCNESWEEKAKEEFPGFSIDNAGSYYIDIIEKHMPSMGKRQDEFQKIISKSFPSYGYCMLAKLLTHKLYKNAFGPVITPNFDSLVRQAFESYTATIPFEVHYEGLSSGLSHNAEAPTIIKIHGDPFVKPLNTFSETVEYSAEIKKNLRSLLPGSGIIFIGYSAGDNAVFDLFSQCDDRTFNYNIYWVGDSMPRNNFGYWLKKNNARHVKCNNFDFLMFIIQLVFDLSHAADLTDRMKRKYYLSFESAVHCLGKYAERDKEMLYKKVDNKYPLLINDIYTPMKALVTSKLHKNLPFALNKWESGEECCYSKEIESFTGNAIERFPYSCDILTEHANYKSDFLHYIPDESSPKQVQANGSDGSQCNRKDTQKSALSVMKENCEKFEAHSIFVREYAIIQSMAMPVGLDPYVRKEKLSKGHEADANGEADSGDRITIGVFDGTFNKKQSKSCDYRDNYDDNEFDKIMTYYQWSLWLRPDDVKTLSYFVLFLIKFYILYFIRNMNAYAEHAGGKCFPPRLRNCIAFNCLSVYLEHDEESLKHIKVRLIDRKLVEGVYCDPKCCYRRRGVFEDLGKDDCAQLHDMYNKFINVVTFINKLILDDGALRNLSSEFYLVKALFFSAVGTVLDYFVAADDNVYVAPVRDAFNKLATKTFEMGSEEMKSDCVLNYHFAGHLSKIGSYIRARKYLNRSEYMLKTIPVLRQELIGYYFVKFICRRREGLVIDPDELRPLYEVWKGGARYRKVDLIMYAKITREIHPHFDIYKLIDAISYCAADTDFDGGEDLKPMDTNCTYEQFTKSFELGTTDNE